MTKLKRLFASCLLVVALSTIAFANGGDTLTPPQAPPQPPSAESTTGASGSEPSMSSQDSSVDIVTDAATMLVTWLAAALF
jgi:hypothetical protein